MYTVICDNPFYKGQDTAVAFERVEDHAQTQVDDLEQAQELVRDHPHLYCPALNAQTHDDMPDAAKEDSTSTDTGDGDAGDGADSSDAPASPEDEPQEDTQEADDLTVIDGIGPSTAQGLEDAGIDTIAQLADADAEALAEAMENVTADYMSVLIERAANYE